jgi:hypothetical protein
VQNWSKGMIMAQILCTHECKWKKRYLLKLFLQWQNEEIKENCGGGEFKNDVFDIL